MPIKYGLTIYDKIKNQVYCKSCGYSWEPNNDELSEIKAGHRLSCLHCRAMNELKPGEIVPRNIQFKIGTSVRVDGPDKLRGDNYRDQEIDVIHIRCKRSFKANLLDVRQGNIECPYCSNSIKLKAPIDENQRGKRKEQSLEIKDKSGNNVIEYINKSKDLESVTRTPLTKGDKKLGMVLRDSVRIMDIDPDNDRYVIQCVKCGAEETRSLSILKNTIPRDKLLCCSRCKETPVPLDTIRKEYIGKVFNGQMIEDVYQSDEGYTLCNLVCLRNKGNTSLNSYITQVKNKQSSGTMVKYIGESEIHTQTGVPLGDVINKRNFCPICGEQLLTDIPKLSRKLNCIALQMYRHKGIKATNSLEQMKLKDFYLNIDASLCDFCSLRDKCEFAGRQIENTLKFISTTMDMEDSLLNDMLVISSSYPSAFRFSETDAKHIDIMPDKELIVFKDAFIGDDGNVYKLCKCRRHGTELTLNDSEISSFEHKQCFENNPYMRFFKLPSQIYLSDKEQAGNSGKEIKVNTQKVKKNQNQK